MTDPRLGTKPRVPFPLSASAEDVSPSLPKYLQMGSGLLSSEGCLYARSRKATKGTMQENDEERRAVGV